MPLPLYAELMLLEEIGNANPVVMVVCREICGLVPSPAHNNVLKAISFLMDVGFSGNKIFIKIRKRKLWVYIVVI
jgi:hypothetical protein